MNTVMTVLRILSDGRFHSGRSVGENLGISRAAVWKAVQKLQQDWQIKINAVSGRGYQLATPLELLDRAAILAAMQPQFRDQLQDLHILSSVDSTNRYALDQISAGISSGLAVLAEHQTAGRGRRGRQWVSPFGRNLYLSLMWKFDVDAAQLSGLSLAIAVAILRALVKLGIDDIGLKWPNDLIWEGKKLSGVLLEMRGETNGPWLIVIGIGMNVNMDAIHSKVIDQPWVDLQTIKGKVIERNQLAGVLLDELLHGIACFQKSGLGSFLAEWREHDICLNCPVELHFPDRVQQGIARGIDEHGALLLETDGVVTPFNAGEVSLRVSSHGE
jgi:BirA family biotin operon repressor/biotin-[acetyl-CoA-carboxylase] ligase